MASQEHPARSKRHSCKSVRLRPLPLVVRLRWGVEQHLGWSSCQMDGARGSDEPAGGVTWHDIYILSFPSHSAGEQQKWHLVLWCSSLGSVQSRRCSLSWDRSNWPPVHSSKVTKLVTTGQKYYFSGSQRWLATPGESVVQGGVTQLKYRPDKTEIKHSNIVQGGKGAKGPRRNQALNLESDSGRKVICQLTIKVTICT